MRELNVKQIEQINGGRFALLKFALKMGSRTGGYIGPDKYSGQWHG